MGRAFVSNILRIRGVLLTLKIARNLRVAAMAAIMLASMTLGVTIANADDSSKSMVKGAVYVGSIVGRIGISEITQKCVLTGLCAPSAVF